MYVLEEYFNGVNYEKVFLVSIVAFISLRAFAQDVPDNIIQSYQDEIPPKTTFC
jgi:hypothetical protein